MKQLRLLVLVVFFTFNGIAQENIYNCYTIIVGKDVSTTKRVMVAHNEDDTGEQIVSLYKIPGKESPKALKLKAGAKYKYPASTFEYLWIEMQEMFFADCFLNEKGVAVVSNMTPSKEESPELTDGGISYAFRKLVAEQSASARNGVEIAGKIIEKYGYASSGRTYTIADKSEAWVLSVINGKHWIAQRVPDDKVAIIPNYYTITEYNLKDTANFMASTNFQKYIDQNNKEGKPTFREIMGSDFSLTSKTNIYRHWMGLNSLSTKNYKIDDNLPFCFIPRQKLSRIDLMRMLRNHYEGTAYFNADEKGNPHGKEIMTICAEDNQFGLVIEFTSSKISGLESLIWFSPRRPCINPFVPLFYGVENFPEEWQRIDKDNVYKTHFKSRKKSVTPESNAPFRQIDKQAAKLDANYEADIKKRNKKYSKIEDFYFNNHDAFIKKMSELYNSNPKAVPDSITDYTIKALNKLVK